MRAAAALLLLPPPPPTPPPPLPPPPQKSMAVCLEVKQRVSIVSVIPAARSEATKATLSSGYRLNLW